MCKWSKLELCNKEILDTLGSSDGLPLLTTLTIAHKYSFVNYDEVRNINILCDFYISRKEDGYKKKIDLLIKELADKYFLSPSRIESILYH